MAEAADVHFLRSGERNPEASPALGPGMHPAFVELAVDGRWRVRTPRPSSQGGAQHLWASPAPFVDKGLVEECMRTGRLVVLADTDNGVEIIGALQTQKSVAMERDGTLLLEAKRVELRAEEDIRLEVGASSLALRANGRVRLNAHRMVMDVDANLRVLSALVEFP